LFSQKLRRLKWRLGRKLYTSARGDIANEINFNGEQMVQREILRRAVKGSGPCIVLDVGANLGHWTRSCLEIAVEENLALERLNIRSFEPVPTTRAVLKENLKDEVETGHVTIYDFALSDVNDHATMTINGRTSGSNSLERDPNDAITQTYEIDVEIRRLDDFAQDAKLEHLHLVKCDTEGHDAKVVMGAKKLFKASKIDLFQFEYNHRWVYSRHFLKDMFDFVKELNGTYKIARLSPKRLEVFEDWQPEMERFFEANYALVRTDILSDISHYLGTYDVSNTYG